MTTLRSHKEKSLCLCVCVFVFSGMPNFPGWRASSPGPGCGERLPGPSGTWVPGAPDMRRSRRGSAGQTGASWSPLEESGLFWSLLHHHHRQIARGCCKCLININRIISRYCVLF